MADTADPFDCCAPEGGYPHRAPSREVQPLEEDEMPQSKYSKWVALLLALLVFSLVFFNFWGFARGETIKELPKPTLLCSASVFGARQCSPEILLAMEFPVVLDAVHRFEFSYIVVMGVGRYSIPLIIVSKFSEDDDDEGYEIEEDNELTLGL